MEREISRGQAVTGGGLIGRLDPRCKLYILPIYVVLLLLSDSPVLLGIATAYFLTAWLLSGLPLPGLIRSGRSVLLLALVTQLLSLIWGDLVTAGLTFWRLTLIALMSVIFSKTTAPRDILDGLRQGYPITEGAAMSLTIALDFLPQLGREMEELRCAAISRGAMLEEGSIPERVRDFLPLLIPLFRKTIRHAEVLSDAMDVRGYNAGGKRTRLEPLQYSRADRVTLILTALYVLSVTLLLFLGV